MTAIPLDNDRVTGLAVLAADVTLQLEHGVLPTVHMQRWRFQLIGEIDFIRAKIRPDEPPAGAMVVATIPRLFAQSNGCASACENEAELPVFAGEPSNRIRRSLAELVLEKNGDGHAGSLAETQNADPFPGACVGGHGPLEAFLDIVDRDMKVFVRMVGSPGPETPIRSHSTIDQAETGIPFAHVRAVNEDEAKVLAQLGAHGAQLEAEDFGGHTRPVQT